MKQIFAWSGLVALTALTACAMPTPFQPAAPDGLNGYQVQQIEQNRFRVSFNGNQLTPRGTVEDNLTFLAAEVTLKNGYDYFVLSRSDTGRTTAYPTFIGPDAGFGWGWYQHDFFGDAGYQTDFSRPTNEYDASGDILLYKGTKPANDPMAYDAHDVAARLTPTINRQGARPGPF